MKKVLLPLDGSTRSLRTIEMVKHLYPNRDAEITLLMVLPDQTPFETSMERDRDQQKATQQLPSFAQLLEGWPVKTVLLRGNPGPEIVQFAREKEYDALAMTRSTRGTLQRLGSVAAYVVKNAQFLDLFIMREAEK